LVHGLLLLRLAQRARRASEGWSGAS